MKSVPGLGHHNYSSDKNLLKRMVFAKHCRPKINLIKEIVRLLGIGKEDHERNILDVGCGNGQDLIKIRKEFGFRGELVGIDIAEGILKIAQKLNRAEKSGIRFATGNAENLRLPDNTFENLILKHVLHNVYSPLQALQECARVLKSGGEIAIAVNSQKTRLILRRMRPKIAEILNLKFFPDPDRHLNLENIQPVVRKVFRNFLVTKLQSEVRLKSVRPYVDYIDSGRSFWGKVSDSEWQRVLDFSKNYLGKILKQKGEIRDYVTIGVIVARK